MTYISSASMLTPMRQSILSGQSALAQAQTEVGSGLPANLAQTLGSQTGRVISMASTVDTLAGYTANNGLASSRLDTTSTALDSILSTAQSVSAAVLAASTTGASLTALSGQAQSAIASFTGSLNTSLGGEYIFGGINTASPPIANYFASGSTAQTADAAAFSSAVPTPASATTDQMNTYLASMDTLYSASNWTNWSSANSTAINSTIAPGQTQTTSVSANQGAFRQVAEAYAIINQVTSAGVTGDAKNAALAKATSLLGAGISGLTDIQTAVGVSQNAVTTAGTMIASQTSVLKSNIGNMEDVDSVALSTKVTALQNQLEASYSLTSRLQSLSLVNYLSA